MAWIWFLDTAMLLYFWYSNILFCTTIIHNTRTIQHNISTFNNIYIIHIFILSARQWCSGNMKPFQGLAGGSIPSWRILFAGRRKIFEKADFFLREEQFTSFFLFFFLSEVF